MRRKLTNRLEIRADSSLIKSLDQYCLDNRIKQSEVLREAVSLYLECGPLKKLLMESLKSDRFLDLFREFLKQCPMPLSVFFENYLGPEEEKMAEELPLTLSGLRWEGLFITNRGKKAYLRRRGKIA